LLLVSQLSNTDGGVDGGSVKQVAGQIEEERDGRKNGQNKTDNVCHKETESSLMNFVSLNLKPDAGVIYCWYCI
jgi:hypothetical protein